MDHRRDRPDTLADAMQHRRQGDTVLRQETLAGGGYIFASYSRHDNGIIVLGAQVVRPAGGTTLWCQAVGSALPDPDAALAWLAAMCDSMKVLD